MDIEIRVMIRSGKRDIKLAFQSDERIHRVAQHDGMLPYDEGNTLRTHYFNTGRQILRLLGERRDI